VACAARLPLLAAWGVLYFGSTQLFNWVLKKRVNAPAYVERVEPEFSLSGVRFKLYNFTIENPEGFPSGKMLHFSRGELEVRGLLKELNFKTPDLYAHFIRNEENVSNFDVAFKRPVKKESVKPIEFEIVNTSADVSLRNPLGVTFARYAADGEFKGLGNDARFTVSGSGKIKGSPETETDFQIYNWRIENNPYLQKLAKLLGKPELSTIELSKIVGSAKTSGDWIIFGKTDAYREDKLFVEIYPGSRYNRVTKELDVRGKLFYPIETEFRITGTADDPKVSIGALDPQQLINQLQSVGEEITQQVKEQAEQLKEELTEETQKLQQELQTQVNELKSGVNETVNELRQNLQNLQNETLKQIKAPVERLKEATQNATDPAKELTEETQKALEELNKTVEKIKEDLKNLVPIKLP